jgi:hypothetical protein
VTQVIKTHDSKLFCKRIEGKLCVFRQTSKWEHYLIDDQNYLFARSNPYFVFALTDNWRFDGNPVDHGLVPIVERLKAIDLWARDIAGECEASLLKEEETNLRKRRSDNEAFLKDYRREFAKTFNDINTSSLAKKDKRKRGDKKICQ